MQFVYPTMSLHTIYYWEKSVVYTKKNLGLSLILNVKVIIFAIKPYKSLPNFRGENPSAPPPTPYKSLHNNNIQQLDTEANRSTAYVHVFRFLITWGCDT